MKTTVQIPDSLIKEARKLAAEEQTTLKALMEEGLRRIISEHRRRGGFKLRKATFGGKGFHNHLKGAAWLESPGLLLLSESEDYWQQLRSFLKSGRVCGLQVHDARIAALCRYHGVTELWTADRDFGRFPHQKVRNLLAG